MGPIDRKLYWIGLAVLLVLSTGIIVLIHSAPMIFPPAITAIPAGMGLMYLVTGRFEDAGWSRWFTLGLAFPLVAGPPTAIAFVFGSPLGAWVDGPVMRPILALAVVALVALIAVAGVLRSAAPASAARGF
jgi:hypothetical protein